MNKDKSFCIGDSVKVLIDYSLCLGTIVKINPKGIKVLVPAYDYNLEYLGTFKYEKICKLDTKAVLVWEQWKGKNGRGSYRLDTIMYPELAKPVSAIGRSTYLYEDNFGIASEENKHKYAESFAK